MKKYAAIVICVILILSVSGCAEAKAYKEAVTSFEAGEYSHAIELFKTIPDYKDVSSLQTEAEAKLAYQEAVAAYEEAEQLVANENSEIDAYCEAAQTLLDSDKIPYEESKKTELQVAISTLREMKKSVEDMPENITDILSVVENMNTPVDYSKELASVQGAQQALENSIKQMEQVTNPTGDFVIIRLSQIEGIGEIQGVTEDNDPNGHLNKQGGYTSATYFSSLLINPNDVYGKDVVDKGTECGGCIEVFSTEEDAKERESYLSSFDGVGFLSPGSHVVLGTIVIRTSDLLTATQQKDLTAAITAKLVELP